MEDCQKPGWLRLIAHMFKKENNYNIRNMFTCIGLNQFLYDIQKESINGNNIIFYVVLDLAAICVVLGSMRLNLEHDCCYLCGVSKQEMRLPGCECTITKQMSDYTSLIPDFPLSRLIYDPCHALGNTICLALHGTFAVLVDTDREYMGKVLQKAAGYNIAEGGLAKRYKPKKAKEIIWKKIKNPTDAKCKKRKTAIDWILNGVKDEDMDVCDQNDKRNKMKIENVLHTIWMLIIAMVLVIYTETPTKKQIEEYITNGKKLQWLWTLYFPVVTFCPTGHHFCHHLGEVLLEHGSLYRFLNEGSESSNRDAFNCWLDATTQMMANHLTGMSGLEDMIRIQTAKWEMWKAGIVKSV